MRRLDHDLIVRSRRPARRLGYAIGLAGPILLACAICAGIPATLITYYLRTR